MSAAAVDFLAIKNPHHLPLKKLSSLPAFPSSSPLKLETFRRPCCCRVSIEPPKGLGFGFPSLRARNSSNRSIAAFAVSHEDSKHPELEVEKEKIKDEESEEAWEKSLASLKEQALKMKSISQEKFEMYSKKAMDILEETSVQLEIQTVKLVKDMQRDTKELVIVASDVSPEPVKDILVEYSSALEEVKEGSQLRDFHLGIPYGFLLKVGGFLSFMLTGSISAVRFGIILGGTLLALSILSLKAHQKGELSSIALKGQTAIAAVLFLREMRLLYQSASIFGFLTTALSGAMLVFYLYRITMDGRESKGSDLRPGAEN